MSSLAYTFMKLCVTKILYIQYLFCDNFYLVFNLLKLYIYFEKIIYLVFVNYLTHIYIYNVLLIYLLFVITLNIPT